MYALLIYHNHPNYLSDRGQYRSVHLGMAEAAVARGELALGGALAEPAEQSFLVFKGPRAEEAAREFAENDPYVRNGLVARWEVKKWTVVTGTDFAS